MATFRCLHTGSRGNCYLLNVGNEILVIELGVNWNEILEGLNYKIKDVAGILVTHRHLDHLLSIINAFKYGLSVFSCEDVKSIHKEVKVLKKGFKTQINGFKVQPVPLFHNVECIGFVIEHENIGKLLFCTDTHKIPYKFKGLNHIIVECNYDDEIMIDNLCNNIYSQSASENHMGLNDTREFLRNNYSCELQTIVLIHASSQNLDKKKARKMVQQDLCFDNVYVAKKGMEIELNLTDF